ncbi:hypothetical protein [Novosphingobium percolationis]|uniref:hypothetical protein n=1 Tax=Novosphingobium percolationis TaxID=2871811 RepID=UPI001CD30C15|nr:hypothetical protein [Novosphingobium percolationis]
MRVALGAGGARNCGAVDMVESGIKAGQQGRRSRIGRRMAVHALRFASILVGAGLILRAGASERAMSAVDVDDDRSAGAFPALPKQYALAMPQPAFGGAATFARQAPTFAQQAAFAAPATAPKPGLAAPAMSKVAEPAASKAALVAVRDDAAKASVPSELQGLAKTPAAHAAVPTIAAPAVVPAASLLQAAPAIVSHPNVGVAPSANAPTAAAMAPAAQAIVHPVTPGTPSVAAPALALPTQAAPVAGVHPRQVSQPSDLESVLHSPASAWDYAEAVPDELRGTPAMRQSYPAPAF